jgi:nucleoside-diphosphate-sugar epimerase
MCNVLSDEKILVTGAAGQIAFPIVEHLATDNEVWGVARFSKPEDAKRLEAVGVHPFRMDLGDPDFSELPADFTYVVHLVMYKGTDADYDAAMKANAEATGFVLHHCRRAKAALVLSTHSVYKPHEDPLHVFVETDPLGDVNSTHSPTYSVTKIGGEAVARTCARLFDLPVTIARMNASYGPNGGLPAYQMDAVVAGQAVVTRWDPCMYSPIHQTDINEQVEPLLAAASVPATIVNWAGDEPVSVQEWCRYVGKVTGRADKVEAVEIPGTLRGSVADHTKRARFTGPCKVNWHDGFLDTLRARHGADVVVTPG